MSSEDKNGIEYTEHGGNMYYNQGNAAKYVGMTDTGFRRKRRKVEEESGIVIPLVILPVSRQTRFIDKRILDVFRQSVRVGQEERWIEDLRRVVNEVNADR